MKSGDVAGAIGRGIVAGLVGTAAITLSTLVEMKLRNRPPSTAPAKAAGKVMGVKPVGENEEQRFSNMIHWEYGVMWGAARGLLDLAGLDDPAASAAHFGAVWGTALVMLPALQVAKPVTQWKGEEIATDAVNHLVYAAATGLTYDFLKSHSTGRTPRHH